jgi:hypothetical protein
LSKLHWLEESNLSKKQANLIDYMLARIESAILACAGSAASNGGVATHRFGKKTRQPKRGEGYLIFVVGANLDLRDLAATKLDCVIMVAVYRFRENGASWSNEPRDRRRKCSLIIMIARLV